MERRRARHEGKAVGVAFLFIVLIVGIFLWQRLSHRSEETSSGGEKTTTLDVDIRDVRFWSGSEVKKRLDQGEKIIFLDTRSDEAYHTAHILDSHRVFIKDIERFIPEAGAIYILILEPSIPPDQIKSADETLKKKKMNYAFFDGGISTWEAIGGQIYSWGDPNLPVDQSKVTYIAPEKAASFIHAGSSVVFLDVRDPSDFAASHIPQAINIPLSHLEARHKELPVGKEFVVYGADELTAFQGAVRLFDMHSFGPRVLEGGFSRWQDKKLPIEK